MTFDRETKTGVKRTERSVGLLILGILFSVGGTSRADRGPTALAQIQSELFASTHDSRSDIDEDGFVNPDDLLLFIQDWNTTDSSRSDINGDGFVDAEDLLLLLRDWHAVFPTPTPTPLPTPAFDEIEIDLAGLPQGAKPLTLVRIPAGSFLMGSSEDEAGRWDDEGPVRAVTIGYDFYMGKWEVTQEQWTAVMGNNPSYWQDCGNDCPVEQISWNDIRGADGFLDRLNALGVGTFRLPSEAEWEYACRAGTTSRFHFGDSLGCADDCSDCEAGILPGNRSDYMWYCETSWPPGTRPVGGKIPNAFGLYNMHGNVLEFCEDDYQDSYVGLPSDGSPWVASPVRTPYRISRGGALNRHARNCRSAVRGNSGPAERGSFTGFRVVSMVVVP